MKNTPELSSLFDRFYELENPSSSFGWRSFDTSYKFSKSNIICSGELQELDSSSSSAHSTKLYAATSTEMISFNV